MYDFRTPTDASESHAASLPGINRLEKAADEYLHSKLTICVNNGKTSPEER